MKKVYHTNEIAHLWAHQTQSEARNSQNNFYFRDSVIYSYGSHFPIARHVENKRREKAVLFTTRGHSVTTTKHLGLVRQALPGSVQVFNVSQVLRYDSDNNTHKEALNDYAARIVQTLANAKRARSNGPRLMEHAAKLLAEANAYSKFYGLRKTFGTPADFDKLVAKAVADKTKADKANAKRIAEQKEAERIRNAEAYKEALEKLSAWINGESVSLPQSYTMQNLGIAPKLRVSGDTLETSYGATVPATDALHVYKAVKACKEQGREWKRNGERMPVGNFQVDRIESDGTLTAGCHRIEWSETERLGKAQGWDI